MGDFVGRSNFGMFDSVEDDSYGDDGNNQYQSGMYNNDHYNRNHNQDQNQGGSSYQHYDNNCYNQDEDQVQGVMNHNVGREEDKENLQPRVKKSRRTNNQINEDNERARLVKDQKAIIKQKEKENKEVR
jgi:hypothetical protein